MKGFDSNPVKSQPGSQQKRNYKDRQPNELFTPSYRYRGHLLFCHIDQVSTQIRAWRGILTQARPDHLLRDRHEREFGASSHRLSLIESPREASSSDAS
jgi:hypothetical protein